MESSSLAPLAEPVSEASEVSAADAAPDPGTGITAEALRDEQGRYLSDREARYRRELREAQAELDRVRSRLDELQRGEVERLAGAAGMAVPGDLWTIGTELDHLRDDQGRIDPDMVTGIVDDTLRSRPTWRAQAAGTIGIGLGAGAAGQRVREPVGLSALLKPNGR